ncbi:MAG: hypothetical protein Q9169_008771, partial [Polycauliona sp. 2 TL-2023]
MSSATKNGKTIIYTGAPISSSLSWSESQLTIPLQPPFLPSKSPTITSVSPLIPTQLQTSNPQYPAWRSLPMARTHLPTGLTQASNLEFQPYQPQQAKEKTTSFLSTTDLSFLSDSVDGTSLSNEAEDETLSQYYEHSFAVHEEVPSSRVLPADSFTSTSTSIPSSSS